MRCLRLLTRTLSTVLLGTLVFLMLPMSCSNPTLDSGTKDLSIDAQAKAVVTSKFIAVMHVNVNCSDFDRSYKFYKMLGYEIISVPLFGSMKVEQKVDEEFAKGLRLPPYEIVAAPLKSKFDGTIVDLIRFKEPFDSNPPYTQVNHLGIAMLTFETTDLNADMTYLKSQGISFISEPQEITKNSTALRFAALRDPEGNVIQLLENKKATPGKSFSGKKLKIARLLYITINVSDLANSLTFYKMVGFTLSEETTYAGSASAAAGFGLSEAFETKTALVKMKSGPAILLQQWEPPYFDLESPYAMLNHIGYARVAIETSNIQSDYKRLKELGVEFYAEPKKPQGKLAFITFACFEDIDGTVLEAAYSTAPKLPW